MFRVHRVCIHVTRGIIRKCCLVAGNDKVEQDDVVIWRIEYELFDIDFHSPHRDHRYMRGDMFAPSCECGEAGYFSGPLVVPLV